MTDEFREDQAQELPAFDGMESRQSWTFPTDVHVWTAIMGVALIGLVALQIVAEGILEAIYQRTNAGSAEAVPTFGTAVTVLLLGLALIAIYRNGKYFSKREATLKATACVAVSGATVLFASYLVTTVDQMVHVLPHGVNGVRSASSVVGFFAGLEYLPLTGMALVAGLVGVAVFLSTKPNSSRALLGSAVAGVALYVLLLVLLQTGAA